jgi:hypothetical protein
MPDPTYAVHVATDDQGDPTTLANGVVLPSRFRAIYAEHAFGTTPRPPRVLQSAVELMIEVADGSPVVTQLTLRRPADDPVAHRLLKDLPLRKLVDRVLASAAALTAMEASGATDMTDEDFEELQSDLRPFNRRQIDDGLLREVASIVAANPTRPNKAVCEQLHTSARNATRWIKAAQRFKEDDNG